MLTIHDMRTKFVDGDESFGARMRERRWQLLYTSFPDIGSMRVLDLGGTVGSWLRAPVRPDHVHVVNLEPAADDPPAWISAQSADACELDPDTLAGSYDFVFCNSVIEHVGGHYRRRQLAEVIRRSAPKYWVQTPYRYFPVEPHFLFPGFQFLPATAKATVAQRWPLLHTPSADRDVAVRAVLSTELIGRTEMSYYFPDATTIHFERLAGVPKSLIAIKR